MVKKYFKCLDLQQGSSKTKVGLYSHPNGLPGGHFNPVCAVWNLAKDDLDYYYSSARFYKTGIDEFRFLGLITTSDNTAINR